MTNSAKGRDSFDVNTGNTLVHFINRNVTPYPTEAGSVKFDLVPVESQKDLMVNAARMHAQQEYDRIMELVAVLQRQADDIKRRLDITDMVRAARLAKSTGWSKTFGTPAHGWFTLVLLTGTLAYHWAISMCARSSGWVITPGKK